MFCLLFLITEAEFLDEIQTKVLRVFLLAIQSHLYSFALRFIFFQKYARNLFNSAFLYTVKEKEGKPDRKPYPIPYTWFKKPIQKP